MARSGRFNLVILVLFLLALYGAGCGGSGLDDTQGQRTAPGVGSSSNSVVVRLDYVNPRGEVQGRIPDNAVRFLIEIHDAAGNDVVPHVEVDRAPGAATQDVDISGVPLGTWTVLLTAFNEAGQVVGTAQTVAIVGEGEPTLVTFTDIEPTQARFLAVALRGTGELALVDLSTSTIVARIPGGEGLLSVAVSPDGTRALATDNAGDTGDAVHVYDLENQTLLTSVTGFDGPWGVKYHPDGTRAYITNALADTVDVLDTATNTVITSIPIPAGEGAWPQGLAILPDGTRVFTPNNDDNSVAVIDTASNTVLDVITDVPGTGGEPWELAVTPDGTQVWVSDGDTDVITDPSTLTVYDAATLGQLASFTVTGSDGNANARGMDIAPDGSLGVVALANSTDVVLFSPATLSAVGTITTSTTNTDKPKRVVIDLDSARAFVSSQQNDLISIIDLVSRTETGTVPFNPGDRPQGMALIP